MKKVALSLLALALVGAGAFAQEAPALKIGGYLDIGTATSIKSDSGTSTVIKGDDSGVAGGSYVFKLAYGTDKAGFVSKTRLENLTAASGVSTQTSSGITYANGYTGLSANPQAFYAWFLVPAAEAVKVQIGNYDDDGAAWNQLDDKGDKQTKGTGIAVQVTPAEGFSLGGGVVPTGRDNASYSAGAVYSVPGTVKVAAGLLTGLNKDRAIAASNFAASFKLLLDGPLSASGGVNLYGLEQDKKVGYNIIDALVGYAITDAFSASLNTYVYTYGSDLKYGSDDAAISFKVTPGVMYTVDPITAVGAEMTYQQGNADTKAASTDVSPKVLNKLTTITVKPKVNFTIDPNTKVLVYYSYAMSSGDDATTDKTVGTLSIEARYNF